MLQAEEEGKIDELRNLIQEERARKLKRLSTVIILEGFFRGKIDYPLIECGLVMYEVYQC